MSVRVCVCGCASVCVWGVVGNNLIFNSAETEAVAVVVVLVALVPRLYCCCQPATVKGSDTERKARYKALKSSEILITELEDLFCTGISNIY